MALVSTAAVPVPDCEACREASTPVRSYQAAAGMSILTNFSDFASIDEWDRNMCQQGLDLLYAGAGHGPFIDPTTKKKTASNRSETHSASDI